MNFRACFNFDSIYSCVVNIFQFFRYSKDLKTQVLTMEKNKIAMATNSDLAKKTSQPERYKIKVSGLPRFYAMAVSRFVYFEGLSL